MTYSTEDRLWFASLGSKAAENVAEFERSELSKLCMLDNPSPEQLRESRRLWLKVMGYPVGHLADEDARML